MTGCGDGLMFILTSGPRPRRLRPPVRPPVELAELAQIAGARAGVWFDKLTRHEQKQQKQQKGRVHQTGVTRDRGSLGLTGYVVLGRRA